MIGKISKLGNIWKFGEGEEEQRKKRRLGCSCCQYGVVVLIQNSIVCVTNITTTLLNQTMLYRVRNKHNSKTALFGSYRWELHLLKTRVLKCEYVT